jgi:ACS family tartrate transporter-like MFS transporter
MDLGVLENRAMERAVMKKLIWRLMPLLFLCFMAAFIDRVNVSFAKLAMLPDLGMSEAQYATGAGIFFVGYFLFEVPSNLILSKVGARAWIARIMLVWGVVSCSMLAVEGPRSFYALRFLLGAAEAGFFPGVIYYLSQWFPRSQRARAVSLFMLAAVCSFVIGSPVSGWLLEHPQLGFKGWQWLFLVEGLPSIVLGFVVWWKLPNGPRKAKWLTHDELGWLEGRLATERIEQDREQARPLTLGRALTDWRVLLFSLIYFLNVVGGYGLDFYTPTLLTHSFPELSKAQIGWIAAIPPLVALPLMVWFGKSADRRKSHALHVAIAAFVFAIGLGLLALPLPSVAIVFALTLCVAGRWSLIGPFWSLPTALLSGAAAAGGIAWINSLGNLGGQAGPIIVSHFAAPDGSLGRGLAVLAGLLVVCGLVSLGFVRRGKAAPATLAKPA